MRKTLFVCLLCMTMWLATSARAGAQDRIVLGIGGDWWDSDGRKLGFASAVTGACVYGESGSLQVGDANSGEAQVFVYEKMAAQCPQACPARVSSVPPGLHCDTWPKPGEAVAEASALGGGSISRFFPRLMRSPQLYVVAAARGLEAEPRESVVSLKGSEPDLTPALRPMAAGTYAATLEPLDESKTGKSTAGKVVWQPGARATLTGEHLHPGLYKLTVTLEGGDSEGSEAWVLLSAAGHYEADLREFERMSRVTENWGDKIDESGKRALLRACLQALSERDAGR